MEKILLVDDDEGLLHFLQRFFTKQGYSVRSCSSGQAALEIIAGEEFDLILLDYKMPGLNGLDTLKEVRRLQVKTPVIIMTAYGTTDTAIEAMRLGAYDYLLKPFDREELQRLAADALEVNSLMKQEVSFPGHACRPAAAVQKTVRIVGNHRRMQEVYKLIGQVADKDVTVLITGESGTGKELVARAIYHHSHRQNKPFMAINCAAIPEMLLESELFGYERGAFTGAERTHIGRFERCRDGTLFFDEIGDMSLATQAKVLRVLQYGEFERLGGKENIRINVRIIAATNKNLEKEVELGRFREDLYWRLKVISIHLPPLRERPEDIPALAEYFVSRFSEEYQTPIRYVSGPAMQKLTSHTWPGNVRELENCMRRAVLLSLGDVILEEHLKLDADPQAGPGARLDQLMASIDKKLEGLMPDILRLSTEKTHANVIDLVEKVLIAKVLEQCGYNQVKAAKLLGISRNTLRHRIKKFHFEASRPAGDSSSS
ncbi:MAG: sigma-54-dependent Fis family transcriptional regulator [Deltaproteobacteria bacterium]|nr:sigma-54-dependent Fis family transcriptional regulator [Deltaproteobacteria bacterium]